MKKTNLEKQQDRKIEIYKKHYDVDEVNKVIHVVLHYETVSEILCENVEQKGNPVFSRSFLDKIDELLTTFPKDYRISIDLKIDNYEGYDPNVVLNSFNDFVELEYYRTKGQVVKAWITAIVLLLVGFGALLWLNVMEGTGLMSDNLLDNVIDYFADTLACVFMWEAIGVLLLYPADFVITNNRLFAAFDSVRFTDSEGNILCQVTRDELFSDTIRVSKKQKLGSVILATNGTAHIIVGATLLSNFLITLSNADFSSSHRAVYSVLVITVSVMQIIFGIGCFNNLRGKGPFKSLTMIACIILLFLYAAVIAFLVICCLDGYELTASLVVSITASVLITSLSLFACIITRKE